MTGTNYYAGYIFDGGEGIDSLYVPYKDTDLVITKTEGTGISTIEFLGTETNYARHISTVRIEQLVTANGVIIDIDNSEMHGSNIIYNVYEGEDGDRIIPGKITFGSFLGDGSKIVGGVGNDTVSLNYNSEEVDLSYDPIFGLPKLVYKRGYANGDPALYLINVEVLLLNG